MLLECKVTGRPVPIITWKRNGLLVKTSPRIYISPDRSQLQIFSVQQENAGMYTCLADNVVGDSSGTITVTVLQSPELKERYKTIEKVIGEDLELSCISDVTPLPEVTWFFDGQKLLSHNKYAVDRGDSVGHYKRQYEITNSGQVLKLFDIQLYNKERIEVSIPCFIDDGKSSIIRQ